MKQDFKVTHIYVRVLKNGFLVDITTTYKTKEDHTEYEESSVFCNTVEEVKVEMEVLNQI